jgi:hypothetical protein
MIRVTIPIRTVSEPNQRDHWAVRAKRTKRARMIVALRLRSAMTRRALLGRHNDAEVVTLTRISSGLLDDDNLRGALKACRDGVADALGIDDRDPRVAWRYDQRRGKRGQYAVEITIIRAESLANAG